MSKLIRALIFTLAAALAGTLVWRGLRRGRDEAPTWGGLQSAGRSQADVIDAMSEEQQQKLLDELDQHV